MPEWTAPFQLPKFTTEEFIAKRDAYTDQHGFEIHLPGFSDIIKLGREKKMTEQEQGWWTAGTFDYFPPGRLDEIYAMKEKRRKRYHRMLASPTPGFMLNMGSVMTSLDNAQDAISTLAWLGRLGIRFLPRILGRILLGPVGWMLAIADVLSFQNYLSLGGILCMARKRNMRGLNSMNPFNKQCRLRRARRLARAMPTFADFIQGAQVGADVFGWGICLGPLVGLAQDIVWGTVAKAAGVPVTIHSEVPDFPPWIGTAYTNLRHLPILARFQDALSDEDHLMMTASYSLSTQVVEPYARDWNPIEHTDEIEDQLLVAPAPTNILTREVIQEEGHDPDKTVGWPGTHSLRATRREIYQANHDMINTGFRNWCWKKRHDWIGLASAMYSFDGSLRMMTMSDLGAQVFLDDTCEAATWRALLEDCYHFKPVRTDPVLLYWWNNIRPKLKPHVFSVPQDWPYEHKELIYWFVFQTEPGTPQFTIQPIVDNELEGIKERCTPPCRDPEEAPKLIANRGSLNRRHIIEGYSAWNRSP